MTLDSQTTQRIDVAILLLGLGGGGLERMRLNLAAGLHARGVRVSLIIGVQSGPYGRHVPPGIEVVLLHADRMTTALPKLVRYLRLHRPRTLLTGLDYANVAALALRPLTRPAGIRTVVSVHKPFSLAVSHSALRRDRWLLPTLVRALYPRADAVIAVSEGVADDLAQVARMDRDRIRVIYNPVLTLSLDQQAAVPAEHPWLANPDVPVLLAAGRLHPEKDYPTMLRAFALARESRRIRLIILGEGEERKPLEELATDLGVGADVDFRGFDINPLPYMKSCALFVMSSTWEGFGNVLVEALACGTPVVSTDCPVGPREILEAGRHGLLVPVGDAVALAAAMLSGLTEHPSSAQLRRRAEDFGIDRAVNQYRSALGV